MLKVSQIRAYSANVKAAIAEIKSNYVIVTKAELFKFMNDHSQEDNILMLALVAEHGMDGTQGTAQWENSTGFFFLEKTIYSEHDHDSYLDIFERTGNVAEKFIHKLLTDKADNKGLFCGFLAQLAERSITMSPVKALNGCNGYLVQFSLKSSV